MTGLRNQDAEGLTPQRRDFVMAYVGEARGNATEAARIAGYAASGARKRSQKLMRDPRIKAAIARAQVLEPDVMDVHIMSRDEALSALSTIANGKKAAPTTKIKAIQQLSKMRGWEVPKKHVHMSMTREELIEAMRTKLRVLEAGE